MLPHLLWCVENLTVRMLHSESKVPGSSLSAALIFLNSEAKNSKFHYFRIFTKLLNNLSNTG